MWSLCGVVASSVIIAAIPAWGQDHPTFQSLWNETTRKADCAPAEYADFVLVTCKGDLTLWYFTKPSHPAHLGVIKRTIVRVGDTWNASESGYSFASDDAQPAFKKWLAQIVDLDRQMKEDFENRKPSVAP